MTKLPDLTVTKEPPKTENPHNEIPVESPVTENQIREPQLEPDLTEDLNNGAAVEPQVRAHGKKRIRNQNNWRGSGEGMWDYKRVQTFRTTTVPSG